MADESMLDTPTTLRGGVNECGDLFPKTSLLHKKFLVNIQHLFITHCCHLQQVICEHISTIYHQQVITTRNTKNTKNTKNTRCMYNFSFYYGQQSGVYQQQLNRVQFYKSTNSIMQDSTYTLNTNSIMQDSTYTLNTN
jgi:hypothetical protein